MPQDKATLRLGTPAKYRICIQGYLDNTWAYQLGGMTLTNYFSPKQPMRTILTGQLPDQAALIGVLNQLYGLGFPLLSVECLAVVETLQNLNSSQPGQMNVGY
jgi:hypothetical protein